MPYSGPNDEKLPENVRALPENKRAQWVEMWNSVYAACIEDDGEAETCETSAFRQANAVIKEEAENSEGFVYIQLQANASDSSKEVEILRTGTFTDRNGKTVTIDGAMLDAFVANFSAGAAGQEVPFDIDHKRESAAGWLKALRRVGDRLLGTPEWNTQGVELITGKVYRYLSATIDMARKVIKAISLVNFPAVKGLAPLELSEGVLTHQINKEADMSKENEVNLDELRAQVREELLAEFKAEKEQVAELRAQVRTELEAELREEFERRQAFVEFAESVTTGEHALSAKPEQIVELMEALPDTETVDTFKALLKAKVVDFSENGSAGEGDLGEGDGDGKKKLPEPIAEQLRSKELELADLSSPVLNLGDLSQYDLSEFKEA